MKTTLFGRALVAVGLWLSLGVATSTLATSYTVYPFSIPNGYVPSGNAINNNSSPIIVGSYRTGLQTYHAFDYQVSGGILHTFDVPGSLSSSANGISDHNYITGSWERSNQTYQGFFNPGGGIYTVTPEGANGPNQWVAGLNNANVVSGYYQSGSSTYNGLVFNMNTNALVNFSLGSSVKGTFGQGLNNKGYVVGYATPTTQNPVTEGFVFNLNNSSITVYTITGQAQTYISGINDAETFAGSYTQNGHTINGFIANSSGYSTFDVPGAISTTVNGINNNGWVVGSFETSTTQYAFYAVPTALSTDDLPSPLNFVRGSMSPEDLSKPIKVELSDVNPFVDVKQLPAKIL